MRPDDGYAGASVPLLAIVFLAILALILVYGFKLHAHDADGDPAITAWMMKQEAVGGFRCCEGDDAIYPEEWGADGVAYWVVVNGKRLVASADRLIDGKHGPNPTGRAVVWIWPKGSDHVQCFAPGTLG